MKIRVEMGRERQAGANAFKYAWFPFRVGYREANDEIVWLH